MTASSMATRSTGSIPVVACVAYCSTHCRSRGYWWLAKRRIDTFNPASKSRSIEKFASECFLPEESVPVGRQLFRQPCTSPELSWHEEGWVQPRSTLLLAVYHRLR